MRGVAAQEINLSKESLLAIDDDASLRRIMELFVWSKVLGRKTSIRFLVYGYWRA